MTLVNLLFIMLFIIPSHPHPPPTHPTHPTPTPTAPTPPPPPPPHPHPHAQRSCWGVYWFHSVRPSVRLSVHSASRVRSVAPTVLVRSISIHLIKQLQKVCRMERVFFAKFQNLNFWQFFKLCNFDFVLFWLGIWCESLVMVIMDHGVAGGISECRHSSCYSWFR